jgi:hypothetical protein
MIRDLNEPEIENSNTEATASLKKTPVKAAYTLLIENPESRISFLASHPL